MSRIYMLIRGRNGENNRLAAGAFRPYFSRKEVTILCVYTNPVNLRSSAFSRLVVAFSRISFSQFLFLSFGKVYQIKSVCVYISCRLFAVYFQPCTVAKFFLRKLSIARQLVTIKAVKMYYDFIPSFREVLVEGTFCKNFPTLLPFGDVYPSSLVYVQLIAGQNFPP